VTLGVGTFFPQGQFAAPRSYYYGVWLSFDTGSVVNWTDNRADFQAPGGVVTGAVVFHERFWEWSSNKWTLDHMLVESWYAVAPSPTEIPLPYNLQFYTEPSLTRTYLLYEPFGAPGSAAFKHAMPPAPPDYWMPPFP